MIPATVTFEERTQVRWESTAGLTRVAAAGGEEADEHAGAGGHVVRVLPGRGEAGAEGLDSAIY